MVTARLEYFDDNDCSIKAYRSGSYGVVYKAVYHGTQVAAKKLHGIFFEGVSPAEFREFQRHSENFHRLSPSTEIE